MGCTQSTPGQGGVATAPAVKSTNAGTEPVKETPSAVAAPTPVAPQISLPEESPMSGDEFKLTMATKVVKAQAPTEPQISKPTNAPNKTVGGPNIAAPQVITGTMLVQDIETNDWNPSFAVLDRGVLVHCYPDDEDEEQDKVSEPIKLSKYNVARTPESLVLTLRPEGACDRESIIVLELESEKDVVKWLANLQAHISYRNLLNEEAPTDKSFGSRELKNYRSSVQRGSVARSAVKPPAGSRVQSAFFTHTQVDDYLANDQSQQMGSNPHTQNLPNPPARNNKVTDTGFVEQPSIASVVSDEVDLSEMYKGEDMEDDEEVVVPGSLPLAQRRGTGLNVVTTPVSNRNPTNGASNDGGDGTTGDVVSPELSYDTYAYSSPRFGAGY